MSKIKIPFNGTDYNIDEAALASARDSLKTHLSTVMNGEGGGLEFTAGKTVKFKSSNITLSQNLQDDLVNNGCCYCIFSQNDAMHGSVYVTLMNDPELFVINYNDERVYFSPGWCAQALDNSLESGWYDAYDEVTPVEAPSFTLADEYNVMFSLEDAACLFEGATGSTTITFDGTSYQVDPTKLQVATDNFVTHVGTLTGGGLEPITWDGNEEGKVQVNLFDGVIIYAKITDEVFYADELIGATLNLSNGVSVPIEQEMFIVRDNYVIVASVITSVSEANVNVDGVIFPEAGTYFANYVSEGYYVESLAIHNGGSSTDGGDTKLTINGIEYLVDSAKLSDAIDDLHEALGRLSV